MASPDVLIVGSGVAGALIAAELAKAGLAVTILEAGPPVDRLALTETLRTTPWPDDVTRLHAPGELAPVPQYGPDNFYISQLADPYPVRYLRQVGGTTWSWAGAAWRFLPADFQLNTLHGAGRDWPIGYADLGAFYDRAEAEMGVSGPPDENFGSPRQKAYPMAALPLSFSDRQVGEAAARAGYPFVREPAARNSRAYDGRPTCCGSGSCMPLCPTGALYGGQVHIDKAVQAGATLIANAPVTRLEAGPGGRIVAAHYVDEGKVPRRITAGRFVLAAGGIESPRLLLLSRIANASRQVGRNLMDHPGVGMSFLAPEPVWAGRGPVELSAMIAHRDGPFRAEAAAAKVQLSNRSQLTGAVWRAIGKGHTGRRLETAVRTYASRLVNLGSFHEDIPSDDAFLMLANRRDPLGLMTPAIAYRVSDYVRRGAERTRGVMRQIARAMGGTEITFEPGFTTNHHPAGTTIMGADPATSVVDPDCRAHDHPNLFIAGSSVFPSISAVNPTLTIAALALRLADHLKAG